MQGRELRIRITGHALPGRRDGDHGNLHLGLQRGKTVVDLASSDASVATFDLTVEVRIADNGDLNVRGPFVHGTPRERFLYLCWVKREPAGETRTIARAKLFLGDIDRDLVAEALDRACPLIGSLALTNRSGMPVSGGVRPPDVRWTIDGTRNG